MFILTKENLRLAGIFSILSAVFTIPLLVISFMKGFFKDDPVFNNLMVFQISSNIIYTILFCYVMLMLMKLLSEKLKFAMLNNIIIVTIIVSIIGTLLDISSNVLLPLKSVYGTISIFLILISSVLMLIIGIKIRSCKNEFLDKYIKGYSFWLILTAICLLTIIFTILYFIPSIISDIYLALIFFTSSKYFDKLANNQ